MTLSFLNEIYSEIFKGDLRYIVYSTKGIAAIIIVISLVKRLAISFTSTGKMISDNKEGLNTYELIRMFILLSLALASDQVIQGFDYILSIVEDEVIEHMSIQDQGVFEVTTYDFKPPRGSGLGATLSYYLQVIIEKVSLITSGALNGTVELLGNVIDMIIYPIFLAVRYFHLGLLKIFAPLLFALSLYDKLRDYIYNVLKIYARFSLVIIPFMFVNIFAMAIFKGIIEVASQSTIGHLTVTLAQGPIRLAGLLFIIILKFTLFKKSITIMEKLIT